MSRLSKDLPEPPDGTRLVVQRPDGTLIAFWRDDETAREDGAEWPNERWYAQESSGGWTEPVNWAYALKGVKAVYPVGETPLASL